MVMTRGYVACHFLVANEAVSTGTVMISETRMEKRWQGAVSGALGELCNVQAEKSCDPSFCADETEIIDGKKQQRR